MEEKTNKIKVYNDMMQLGSFEKMWLKHHPPIEKLYHYESLPFFEESVLKTFRENQIMKDEEEWLMLYGYYFGETLIQIFPFAIWRYTENESERNMAVNQDEHPFLEIGNGVEEVIRYYPYRPIEEMIKTKEPMDFLSIVDAIDLQLDHLGMTKKMKKGKSAVLPNGITLTAYTSKRKY